MKYSENAVACRKHTKVHWSFPNMTELSIALSDFALSLSSFYGAGFVVQRNIHAALGFLLVGVAAGLGTIRFLNITPIRRRNEVISVHSKLSWLATILGIPLIAAAFCIKYRKFNASQLHVISAMAGITFSILLPKIKDACTMLPSSLAIFSILLHCIDSGNMLGVAGAALYAISSTLVGTSGHIFGIQRVNVFHYCLVIGNIAFYNALCVT